MDSQQTQLVGFTSGSEVGFITGSLVGFTSGSLVKFTSGSLVGFTSGSLEDSQQTQMVGYTYQTQRLDSQQAPWLDSRSVFHVEEFMSN